MKAELFPVIVGALAASILIISATLALTFRLRKLERHIERAISRFDDNEERRRPPKERPPRVEEPVQLNRQVQAAFDSLRSMVGQIPGDTARQIAAMLDEHRPDPIVPPPPPPPPTTTTLTPPAYDAWGRQPDRADGLTQLLAIANRIVQQSSTTLDAFRASAGALATQVVAWPSAADGVPTAFIVEHHGAHYAVPNVVKPARLPKEWFNRSEFGVNDEIQHIVSLPRLRRHGNGYDVQEAGVFGR